MNKSERQAALAWIINQKPIATQEELLAALKAAGIDATRQQFRVIFGKCKLLKPKMPKELCAIRFFAGQRSHSLNGWALNSEVGLTITRVQFLNVIKTLPSNGNLLAAIIDDIDFDQVVGTIAGHDTILVISPDEKQAKSFEEAYRHAFDR